jgi:molecular chaperone Hsp33
VSNPPDRLGETRVRRYLDPDLVVSLAEADFAPIFRAYDEHVRRWELPMDGLAFTMMREGLAALGLHLAARPVDETVGVTINVQTPPLNLFLTGDGEDQVLTGRAFTEAVAAADTGRMFVQSYRPGRGQIQSTIEIRGLDVLGMFEAYYGQSEQYPARFLELDADRYGMVQALPDGGRERVAALDDASARALFTQPLKLIEVKSLRFRCGCTPEKIVKALREIFAGRDEELFQGEPAVEAFCPRCGARWWIERAQYDGGPGAA